jgi:hypothetical protein
VLQNYKLAIAASLFVKHFLSPALDRDARSGSALVERRLDASARSQRQDHEDEGWSNAHLTHRAEHAINLATGAIVGVTVLQRRGVGCRSFYP